VFQGFRRDIREFLRAVEMVVIPSVREGFPMITLEAMAMAKPIIATAIDGIIEQVDHKVDGLLVPPADSEALGAAIVKLLEDRLTREQLGQAARRKTMTTFNVRNMINDTKLAYAELLSQT
jgi:glycosyltransferase involved in cell wall biosynthesis